MLQVSRYELVILCADRTRMIRQAQQARTLGTRNFLYERSVRGTDGLERYNQKASFKKKVREGIKAAKKAKGTLKRKKQKARKKPPRGFNPVTYKRKDKKNV